MSAAILVDITKCVGCEECVLACKKENDLGPDRLRPGQQAVDGLSATRFSTILRLPDDHFVRQGCRHCLDPACVSACLVGAMQKTPEGPVIYDTELCMGCRYCLVACPYGIPRYQWDEAAPLVRKCTLCYPRITEGKEPACVEACPEDALLFGEREELLSLAHQRIAENPDRYVDHVFGESEVGGTSVLYLADISLGFLGWAHQLDGEDLPQLTWASLKKVPWVVAGMGSLMGGIYWVINRRMRLAARAAEGGGLEGGGFEGGGLEGGGPEGGGLEGGGLEGGGLEGGGLEGGRFEGGGLEGGGLEGRGLEGGGPEGGGLEGGGPEGGGLRGPVGDDGAETPASDEGNAMGGGDHE